MYSYDHDLEEFVTIGLGTVSKDGSIITSNVGSGVIKAGWHCGSGPGGSGCTHNCADYCDDCNAACNCVTNTSRPKQTQTPNDCKTAYCGGGMRAANDPKEDEPADCRDPICVGKNHDTKPADETAELEAKNGNNCQYCESGDIKNLKIDYLRVEAEGEEILDIDYDGEPVSVNFTGDARALSNCTIEYLWDFGDGNDSTSQNPTHSYEKPGKYVTTLKVSCEGCEQATKSGSVTVNVNPVRVDLIDVSIESKEVLKLTYKVESGRTLKTARFDFIDDLRELTNKTGEFEITIDPQKVQEGGSLAIASLTFNDDEGYILVEISKTRIYIEEEETKYGIDIFTSPLQEIEYLIHTVGENYSLIRTSSKLGNETHVTTQRSNAKLVTRVNLNAGYGLLAAKFISVWGENHLFRSQGLGNHDSALMQIDNSPKVESVLPQGDDRKYRELINNRSYDSSEAIIKGVFSLNTLFMTDGLSTDLGAMAFPILGKEIEINLELRP